MEVFKKFIRDLSAYKPMYLVSGDFLLHMAVGFAISCLVIRVLSLKNTLLFVLLVAALKEYYDSTVVVANLYEHLVDIFATILGGCFIHVVIACKNNIIRINNE